MCDWIGLVSTGIICATVCVVAWLLFYNARLNVKFRDHEPKE